MLRKCFKFFDELRQTVPSVPPSHQILPHSTRPSSSPSNGSCLLVFTFVNLLPVSFPSEFDDSLLVTLSSQVPKFLMAMITIAECFSSPQSRNIISECLRIKVKIPESGLTVSSLKKAIVWKGYPTLCDTSRMTLILPVGSGMVLSDDMLSDDIEDESFVLALMSPTPHESLYLQYYGGINIPHLLYVHHSNEFRSYMRLPQSSMSEDAGKWVMWNTTWSASLSDLARQFTSVGFNQSIVVRELQRLEQRRLPDHLLSYSKGGVGIFAPNLLFRLWDAVGFNSLVRTERRLGRYDFDCASEFESFGAPSNFSIDTASTAVPPHAEISGTPPPSITSVVMADATEHESACDDELNRTLRPHRIRESTDHERFHESFTTHGSHVPHEKPYNQSFTPPGTPPNHAFFTRSGQFHLSFTPAGTPPNNAFSEASDRRELDSIMDEIARNLGANLDVSAENIGKSNIGHDESLSEFSEFHIGDEDNGPTPEDLLAKNQKEFELERLHMMEQLEAWNAAVVTLNDQLESEINHVEELFEVFEEIRGRSDGGAEYNVELIQSIRFKTPTPKK